MLRQILRASTHVSVAPRASTPSFSRCTRAHAKAPEHDTGTAAPKEISPEFQKEIDAYKANEDSAARPEPAEQLRTLVANESYGTVCTISSSGPTEGYAAGALTPFAVDDQGHVFCCLSNLSSHKRCVSHSVCYVARPRPLTVCQDQVSRNCCHLHLLSLNLMGCIALYAACTSQMESTTKVAADMCSRNTNPLRLFRSD